MLWERLLRRIGYRWWIGAVVLVMLAVNVGWAARHHAREAVPLMLVATLPLLWVRRRPLLVLGAVLAATAATTALYSWSNVFPLWLCVCTVATYKPRRTSLLATIPALAYAGYDVHRPGQTAAKLITIAVAWVLGDTLRARRAWLDEELERNRRHATEAEQARIARELHDVLAHNVSVIVVQASAANDIFDTRPEQARHALRSIEQTGRAALTELRRLLAAVRADEAEAAYAPQPGLANLDGLVDGVRAAGLPVTVHVDGDIAGLPAGLDLSAYRIVQEALTNTLKHASASRAEVGIRRTGDGIELEIVDDGVGNWTPSTGGQGLVGMRERAGLVGGEVAAGPLPGGGFRVRARLPL